MLFRDKNIDSCAASIARPVVAVKVLDKIGNIFKILVEGSVFQSDLPLNVQVGEVLLAKIKSLRPFVLQLNEIASGEILNEDFTGSMLAKLGAVNTSNSSTLLERLVENNEVIVKSRFQKLTGLLDAAGIDLSCGDYDSLPMLLWNYENFQELSDENIKYLKMPLERIQTRIFEMLGRRAKENYFSSPLDELQSFFVVEDDGNTKLLVEAHKRISLRIKGIVDWLRKNIGDEAEEVKTMSSLLLAYLFQRKFYARVNSLPEFLIAKSTKGIRLIQYSASRKKDGINGDTFVINFKLDTGNDGKVEAIVKGDKLNLNMPAGSFLAGQSGQLKRLISEAMQKKYLLHFNVMVRDSRQYELTSLLPGINVIA